MQAAEPALASYLHSSVINHNSLESSLAFILANKLSSPTLLATNLMQMMLQAYTANPVRPATPACLWRNTAVLRCLLEAIHKAQCSALRGSIQFPKQLNTIPMHSARL